MSQGLDTKTSSHFISSYREARESRQVPAERQVLSLEHNRVSSRTAEGWFCCKHCKSKSGATLAKFVIADISHTSFGNPSELFLLAWICFACLMVFSVGACHVLVAVQNTRSAFSLAWLIRRRMTTCDACVLITL